MLVKNSKNITTEIEVDVMIYSTGFHVDRSTNKDHHYQSDHTNMRSSANYQFDLVGVDNFTSDEWTQEGPKAYLGIASPHFPNMFFLLGPNTALGHNSVVFMSECQCNYVVKLLALLQKSNSRYICVKDFVLGGYYQWIRKALSNKV